jgi:hypothetical protein
VRFRRSNGRATSFADDDLDQLYRLALATETVSMSPWHEPLPDEWSAVDRAIEVKLAPAPLVAALVGSVDGRTQRQTKDVLRAANAAAARDLARRTGLSHAQVHAELNLRWGLRRITEATVAQLETRLEQAERWLARA